MKIPFKSTYQIVRELSSVWGDVSDKAQSDITRLVAGVRQGNAFFQPYVQLR